MPPPVQNRVKAVAIILREFLTAVRYSFAEERLKPLMPLRYFVCCCF